MKVYLDGYMTGHPAVTPAAPSAYAPGGPIPEETDFLIVGASPAGCVLAAKLAALAAASSSVAAGRCNPGKPTASFGHPSPMPPHATARMPLESSRNNRGGSI